MYVRWKRRERARQQGGQPTMEKAPTVTLAAQLVVCVRVDGQPRQIVAKHLGTIDKEQQSEAEARRQFWAAVERELRRPFSEPALLRTRGRVHALSEGERAEIRAKIAERVPRPNDLHLGDEASIGNI